MKKIAVAAVGVIASVVACADPIDYYFTANQNGTRNNEVTATGVFRTKDIVVVGVHLKSLGFRIVPIQGCDALLQFRSQDIAYPKISVYAALIIFSHLVSLISA